MNIKSLFLVGCASLVFTGCASLTSADSQPLAVSTKTADGTSIDNVKCTLKNDKGAWEITSPGIVTVHKSAEDLMVECKKPGTSDGFLRAVSRAAGGMWGNILFGGGVGAIIDHNKGNGYDYPNDLPVQMGNSVIVDRKAEKAKEQQLQQQQEETVAQNEQRAVSVRK